MPHDYRHVTPLQQTRHQCQACRREWADVVDEVRGWATDTCPVCGPGTEVAVIKFAGLFDSDTPAEALAVALAGVDLAEDAAKRALATTGTERMQIQAPPIALDGGESWTGWAGWA